MLHSVLIRFVCILSFMRFFMINLDIKPLSKFISASDFDFFKEKVEEAHYKLHDVLNIKKPDGWLNLPIDYNREEFERIKITASNIRQTSDVFVVIGIGGSYLGARAAIEFLNSENYNCFSEKRPKIFFVGNCVSSKELQEILDFCKNKDVSINVISKSGTTLEPAIAFRIFKDFMESKYGKEEATKRIYCTTDKAKGALRNLANKEGYMCFEIPDNIGGRYSVLTAVGLLPMAVSGADIGELLRGAADAHVKFQNSDLSTNDCYKYAILRNILYKQGKSIELITGYEPRLRTFFEWWKQLFGESEGKQGKGIFPASAVFSTDLHSLGQFIQDGSKILFETVFKIKDSSNNIFIPENPENIDGLNYLAGKSLDFVNNKIFEATLRAHTEGNVPNIVINLENDKEYGLGFAFYFFEKACAISAYLLGVNPFDQPGVEAYKKNMFLLLGKPEN